MKRLPEVCPDYDLDRADLHETFTRGVSRTNEQSIYLQSLTDCLVDIMIFLSLSETANIGESHIT